MSIVSFSKYQRAISLGLLPVLLVLFLQIPLAAQTPRPAEGIISNVKWVTRGETIIISYDLSGAPESKFDVGITMRREDDSTFAIVPRTIDGHVGEGVMAGPNREAQWFFRRDVPLGLEGKAYYFEIVVKKMEEHSDLLYYIVGGVAVVGGIIAIVAGKDQPSGPPPPGDLSMPPVRP